MRSLLTVLLFALVGALLVAAPARAPPVTPTDVLVLPIGPSAVTIPLGGNASFRWIAFNNGTQAHLLEVLFSSDGYLETAVSPGAVVLGQGAWTEVLVEVRAPGDGSARTVIVNVTFRATDLATGRAGSLIYAVEVNILGQTVAHDPRGKLLGTWPNPLPAPLDNEWGAFVLTVFFWVSMGGGIVYVIDPVMKRIAKRTKTRLDDVVLGIVRGPVFVLVALYGATNSLEILGIPPEWAVSVERVYAFAFVLALTWVAYRIFHDLLIEYAGTLVKRTSSEIDDRLIPAIEKVGAVVIVILGVVLAVQSLGYDITLFLAGLGVVGLIIAFAAQDTLSNFFAGIHLMLDRPFRRGDLIQLESGEICEVRDIGLRSTKLYWGKGNVVLILPNNKMAGTKIVNYNRPDLGFKVHIPVGVAYGTPVEKVRKAMIKVAEDHKDVLHDPVRPPVFQVDDFGDNAVLVRLIFWVERPSDQWRVASEVREALLKRFAEEGIEIPFPQRVVWQREAT